MDKIQINCKVCQVACELIVKKDSLEISGYSVKGNKCNRGKDFGIKQVTEPSRILTGRVLLKNGAMSRLPVKTTGVVPQSKIDSCMEIFNSTETTAPIKRGDLIIENILGLGVDVVSARKAI